MEKAVHFLKGNTNLLSLLDESQFPFERIYVGNEMCSRLLPDKDEFHSIIEKSSQVNIRISFVTPVHVEETELNKVVDLCQIAGESGWVDEVVVNDWGVLESAYRQAMLKLVYGRMMNRLKRDPRGNLDGLPYRQLSVLRTGNMTNPAFIRFLKSRGVVRTEYDCLPQGVDVDLGKTDLSASLYYPAIPVSYSPICILGATHRQGRAKFIVQGSCQKECLIYFLQVPGVGVDIVGKCTYFTSDSLKNFDLSRFDRIVQVMV
jgi:hypothetical protein